MAITSEEDELAKYKKPLFSVLIANYNNGRYLEKCLQSIISQTYTNWEIVIVDDASTDSSNTIYRKLSNNKRITIVINKKNKGCGYTKRKCVEIAKGEICGFVDADDAITPDALELLTKYHIENPNLSIIYSTHYICDQNLTPQKIADYVGQIPNQGQSWSIQRPVISHFASFKRIKYLATEGISPIYRKAADKDLYYKLEATGPVLFIDRPLYYYRHHSDNISLNQRSLVAYQYELMAKAMVISRHKINKSTLKTTPYTKDELTKGILHVALQEFKSKNFVTTSRLFFQSLCFARITCIKSLLNKILNAWKY
jgi:glycosyltransferase involved in cell wall biosynthesis